MPKLIGCAVFQLKDGTFDFTSLFASLFSMIALLLGTDGKNKEAGWFVRISNFFNPDIE